MKERWNDAMRKVVSIVEICKALELPLERPLVSDNEPTIRYKEIDVLKEYK